MTTMYFRQSIVDILLDEVIMYLRKSRSDDPFLTIEEVLRNHEKELDNWCERNLNGLVAQNNRYKEVVSGETMAERPELQKVLARIEDKNIKYIITNEPSRLSRGYLDEIGKLVLLLLHNNITVITPAKIYNLKDEYDREAFERELKRGNEYLEYTKKILWRGKQSSISEGQYIGGKPPYGYKKVSYKENRRTIKTLEIIEEEAEVVRMIFDWYANKGLSIGEIERKLNDLKITSKNSSHWTRTSIHQMIGNPVYIGKIRWQYRKKETKVVNQQIIVTKERNDNSLLFNGLHTAIVSEELFNKANERKSKNVPTKIGSKMINPLSGLMFCKKCGKAIKLQEATDRNVRVYQCINRQFCSSSSTHYTEIIDVICKTLEQCIEDFEVQISNDNFDEIEEHNKHIAMLEKKLKNLERKEIEQWEAQFDTDESKRLPPHIFKQLNERLLKEKEETKATLERYYQTIPGRVDNELKVLTFKNALDSLRDESVDARIKNEYLKEIIEKITYERDKSYRLTKAQAEEMGIPFENGVCYFKYPFHLEITMRE